MAIVSLTEKIDLLTDIIHENLVDNGVLSIDKTVIKGWSEEYFEQAPESVVSQLSAVKPDFEQIVEQLQSELLKKDAWKDILTAGTGETLLEFIGMVGYSNQLSIQRSLQETHLDTARLESSIIEISRRLGVHINRNTPASVTVDLVNADSSVIITIPEYTQFSVEGLNFFNRDQIVFNIGENAKTVTLYQGEVIELDPLISSGDDFQIYEIGSNDFKISDLDIKVVINNVEWTKTTNGLWQYTANEKVFYENTLSSGNVEIRFGNNVFGASPSIGSEIYITFVNTDGSNANLAESGMSASVSDFPDITGTTTSIIANGQNARDKEFYRIMAPFIFSARDRAVTRDDYVAAALEYPGVIDVSFKGQAEIDPSDKEKMNLIEATILSNPVFTTTQYNAFVDFMNKKSIYLAVYDRVDPTAVNIDVTATVYVALSASLGDEKTKIEKAIREFFTLKIGSLGFSIYKSDIYEVIENSSPNVQYIVLSSPAADTAITKIQYANLNNLSITVEYSTRNLLNIV